MNLSDYQNQFDKLISRKEKSTKFQNFRNSYFSEFLKVGLPTQKWEDWRFTNLSQLKKEKFDISEVHSNSLKRVDLLKYDIEGVITFVFVNGQYQERNQVFPKGLKVSTGLKDFEPHRINVPPKMSDPFELLNTAFVDSALSITIKENIDFKSPIRFLYLSENKTNLMISPKIYLKVSNSSSGTFIEEHFSRKGSLFHNQSTNVKLEKNSTLNHIRIQSNSLKTTTINNITINQKKDTSYNFTQFSEGSGLSRSNINSYLDEEGSQCYINGLSLSKNSQQIDNNIIITHNAPNCTSGQNFRSILKGRSKGVFNGRTIVKQKAQKTNSSQSNKNLLISKDALMYSNPQLEIYADDVKCSHGSTTGQLDESVLFYLQSRGLNISLSKTLLLKGFSAEIFDTIKDNLIKKSLEDKFEIWLINSQSE